MIVYKDSLADVTVSQLDGFFEGWSSPPTPEMQLVSLGNSDEVIVAVEGDNGKVVGFITAITDGVLAAYIPLLEVLPAWREQGIGGELMRRMLERLRNFYMIDLTCDPQMEPFYRQFGMARSMAMSIRNRDWQSGA